MEPQHNSLNSRDRAMGDHPDNALAKSPPSYKYGPLPPGASFRYLMLDPGASSDPLRASLHVSQIEDAPYFEAISYVWGTPNRTIEITCDGQSILITPTLDQVLRRIRLPDRPRSLWTDSLCIDQDNLGEKGHQVALMGRIYRRSDHTLIVAGADDYGHGAPTAALFKDVDESVFTKVRPDWDTLPFLDDEDPLREDSRWGFAQSP